MAKFRVFISLLISLSVHSGLSLAQLNFSGKHFFIAARQAGTAEILLTSLYNATATFYYTHTGETQVYHISARVPDTVTLVTSSPETYDISDSLFEVVNDRSLEITADSDIAVDIVLGEGGKDDDAMSILPCDNQKKSGDYYLTGMHCTYEDYSHPYTMVATCDSVKLEITPSANTSSHHAGTPFSITLNKGQEYSIGTSSYFDGTIFPKDDDITGTKIHVTSAPDCFPLEVYNTSAGLYIQWPTVVSPDSPSVCCADLLCEQLLPENFWDSTYPVVCFSHDTFAVIRIFSATDSNVIKYNGSVCAVLNSGQHYDTLVYRDTPSVIKTSAHAEVTQFMLSGGVTNLTWGGFEGDPDMLWVYSLGQGLTEAYFRPFYRLSAYFDSSTTFFYLTVISKTSNVGTVMLNGSSIASDFIAFPADATMSYAIVPLNRDSAYHLVSAAPVVAYHYEQEQQGSYTYALSGLTVHISDSTTAYKYDTIVKCNGKAASLIADSAAGYLWSTGAHTRGISVTDTGVYIVNELSAVCAEKVTSIQHQFYVIDHVDTSTLVDLLTQCEGQPLIISGDAAVSYSWSTGDTTGSITVTGAGTYTATEVVDKDSCMGILIHAFVVTDIPNDTLRKADSVTKCVTATIELTGDSAISYKWSNGDTSNTIFVADSGAYVVTETILAGGCPNTVIHSFTITDETFPMQYLAHDTTICKGDTITLKTPFTNALWNTGDSNSVRVFSAGTYVASATDSCGTPYRDSIIVQANVCPDKFCNIEFPNAFTPNNDGRNDVFRAITYGAFSDYNLEIYNRWGECVFKTGNVNEGWNGVYNNAYCEVGTYYYYCTATCPLKGKLHFKGDLLLVR